MLEESAVLADDWIWIIDHSAQLAKQNVLLILGIRQSGLPQNRPLRRQDTPVLAIVSSDSHDKESVKIALHGLSEKAGVPKNIVDNRNTELHQGIENTFKKQEKTVRRFS